MRNNSLFYAIVGLFALSLLLGADCIGAEPGANDMVTLDKNSTIDQALINIRDSAATWGEKIQKFSIRLFLGLALISFAWTMGKKLFDDHEAGAFFTDLFFWVITTGIWFWVLKNAPEMMTAIIDSFQVAAKLAGNGEAVSPSTILGHGLDLFVEILKAAQPPATISDVASTVWSFVVKGPAQTVAEAVSSRISLLIAVVFMFSSVTVIAVLMMLQLVNAYLIVYTGYFFVAFAGCEWTRPMAKNYVKSVLACGAELFCTLLAFFYFSGVVEGLIAKISASVGKPGSDFTIQWCFALLMSLAIAAYFMMEMPKVLGNIVSSVVTGINTPFSYRNMWAGVKWTARLAAVAATAGTGAAAVAANLAKEIGKQAMKQALNMSTKGGK